MGALGTAFLPFLSFRTIIITGPIGDLVSRLRSLILSYQS